MTGNTILYVSNIPGKILDVILYDLYVRTGWKGSTNRKRSEFIGTLSSFTLKNLKMTLWFKLGLTNSRSRSHNKEVDYF